MTASRDLADLYSFSSMKPDFINTLICFLICARSSLSAVNLASKLYKARIERMLSLTML